jgi:hypothetical protein
MDWFNIIGRAFFDFNPAYNFDNPKNGLLQRFLSEVL